MKDIIKRRLPAVVRIGLILSPLVCVYGFAPEGASDIALMCLRLALFFGVWTVVALRARTLARFGFGFWVYMTVMYILLIAAVLLPDYSAAGAVCAAISVLPTMPFNMLIGVADFLLDGYSSVPIAAAGAICVIYTAVFAYCALRQRTARGHKDL